MYNFLARDVDKERFAILLKLVERDGCVAFIGSGMSRPLGYRTWYEGIVEGNSPEPTLIQLAGISNQEVQNQPLPEIIDKCKEILKDKYYDFILNEFGDGDKFKYHTNLILLWKSNFQHLITTNFDPSLYYTREDDCKNLVTYPSDKLDVHPQRTLYYLHSRAFVTTFENSKVLQYYVENLVYGKGSYLEAYKNEGSIESFIFNIIKSFSVVFIGFSMTDDDFKNTYEKMKRKWENDISKIRRHPSRIDKVSPEHFILLPYPLKSLYKKDIDFQTEIERFSFKESQLKEININVIGYNNLSKQEHSGLIKLLEVIKEVAPKKKLPILGELGIELSLSESADKNEVS